MKFTARKLVPTIILTIASTIAFSAQAFNVYHYSYSDKLKNRPIESFSTSWNTYNNVLSLFSSFNNNAGKVDKAQFTLTSGGSPNRAKQYFSYNLDLVNNKVSVRDYWNGGTEIASFDNIINIGEGGFSLRLDHTNFDKKYSVGFGDKLGIWHNVHSNGQRIDQIDKGNVRTNVDRLVVEPYPFQPLPEPASVSEPGTLALMGLGLLGMVGRRKFAKK